MKFFFNHPFLKNKKSECEYENLNTGNKQYRVICIIYSISKEERLNPEEEDNFLGKNELDIKPAGTHRKVSQ